MLNATFKIAATSGKKVSYGKEQSPRNYKIFSCLLMISQAWDINVHYIIFYTFRQPATFHKNFFNFLKVNLIKNKFKILFRNGKSSL